MKSSAASLQEWPTTVSKTSQNFARNGDIRFSWEMWPDFDPTKKLVRVDIPLRLHVRGWFDFGARVSYYLYLYVDNRSRLSGYVRWIRDLGSKVERSEVA